VTVLEVIQRSAAFLAGKGVESPRRNVEELLAHVLGLPRLQLYLQFDRVLTASQTDAARELVQRRGRREPLQHLVGSVSFCGLELTVGPQALIPRPETELLAEAAARFLAGLEAREPEVLDFGAGSGCLAVTLAVKVQAARVHALDISPAALELARRNAAAHGVADRIAFHCGDGLAAAPSGTTLDLIVSNPPYIPTAEIARLEPEVRDHDPRAALDGGADGLDYYRLLAAEARPLLEPEGRIMLELGDGQAESVRELFHGQKWIVESIFEDYCRCPRVFVARRGQG